MDSDEETTAVVTGSSSGIGRAIAKRFGEEGLNVVTNSRSGERANQIANEIIDHGGSAVGIEADVSDPEAAKSLIQGAVTEFGSVDILVNNAGHTVIGPAEEIDAEDWRSVLDVNTNGVFFCSQSAGKWMIDRGEGGHIINISSLLSEQGLAQRAPYCASKAAVNNLTKCLAVEWAEHAIHVNAIAPGFVKTNITEQTQASAGYTDEDIEVRTPLGRFGSMEEITNVVVFLANGNHYITGEVIHSDGGWRANAWGTSQ